MTESQPHFDDRLLACADCHGEFIFTAGEQLFFHDKQFKNDPKRCKPCKSRRSGLAAVANGTGPAAAGLSRTETRTECSECGVQTTVPFKPTQGRPVLCRQCFQVKTKTSKPAESPTTSVPVDATLYAMESAAAQAQTASALAGMSSLSPEAATLAAASMAAASSLSSVASAADLASIANVAPEHASSTIIPASLLAAAAEAETYTLPELSAAIADSPDV